MVSLRKITTYHTPLKLRPTLRRLRACPHPWSIFLFLVWPFPWRYHPEYPLPSVAELETHPDLQEVRQPGIRQLFNVPIYRHRDTPLRSLYRLYEDLCAREFTMMSYECEYFFFHAEKRWALAAIPDPQDPDPARYAILASMLEALVTAFNWRLELGLRRDNTLDRSEQRSTNFRREKAPAWTAKVGRLKDHVDFMGDLNLIDEPDFAKRNIKAPNGYLYTV